MKLAFDPLTEHLNISMYFSIYNDRKHFYLHS